MTFADYYNKKNYFGNLQKNIKVKLSKGPTQKQCDDLQKVLQDIFYDKKSIGSNINMDEIISKAYEKEQDRAISNFKLGAPQYTFEEVGKIARSRYEHTTHKQHIEVGTLKHRIEKINKLIEEIPQRKKTEDIAKLEQERAELEVLRHKIKDILGNYIDASDKTKIILKNNESLTTQINEINAIYEKYLSQNISVFIPKDYGDVLEYGLNALNIPLEQLSINIGDKLLEDILNTEGAKLTGSGSSISMKGKFDSYLKTSKDNPKVQKISFKAGKNSFDFIYTPTLNYDSSRQGKVDVILKNNFGIEGIDNFRISAKNWSSLESDFGSTSIAYALLRSVNHSTTMAYIYALQDKKAGSLLQQAHDLAKLSIVADILMGYSQKNNYADVLVVNLRSQSNPQIIVKSLKDIFDDLENNLDKLRQSISNYEDSVLEKRLQTMRQKLRAENSKTYVDMALNYLNSVNVTVYYNQLMNTVK